MESNHKVYIGTKVISTFKHIIMYNIGMNKSEIHHLLELEGFRIMEIVVLNIFLTNDSPK